MFDLSAPEVLVLLMIAAGVLVPLGAALTNRLSARDAVIALAAAIFVPVLGSIVAIVITATRARRHQPS